MDFFVNAALQNSDYRRLSEYLSAGSGPAALVTGVSHIHKAHIIASLISRKELLPLLVIAESEGEAQKLVNDINTMCGAERAQLYPSREYFLGNYEAASREYEQKRIFTLSSMLRGECDVAVCCAEASAQLTIPPAELKKRTTELFVDNDIAPSELVERLISGGYSRCDMIEGPAQFSVRGGIVDIFPPSSKMPFRIEFWGDTIDSISEFDLETQRRTGSVDSISVSPAEETLFDSPEVLCERIEALAKKVRGKKSSETRSWLDNDINKLRSGIGLHSLDKYFPLCYEQEATIFDYAETVLVCESFTTRESARAASLQHIEDLKLLTEEGNICKGLDRFMLTRNEFLELLDLRCRAYLDTFMRGGDLKLGTIINVHSAAQTPPWSGEIKLLEEELGAYVRNKYAVLIYAGTEKGAQTLAEDLTEDGFSAYYSHEPEKPVFRQIIVTDGTLSAGMEYNEAKLAVLTHTAVHAARKRVVKKKNKGEEIRSLSDISVGDLVVHSSHGIGLFEGVKKITSGGISKDYISIRYAGNDMLYVPVTQLDLVSRYIGTGDTSTVKLNKLNSEQWQKSKSRAKTAAKEMASELIALYSKRMSSKGYRFPEDDGLQEDFESHFSYVETDSQLRCIDEIKSDMMRPVPMERLLCGDVGFGKTEVALRAAFKCVEAGKQCAILVPTTVLAWQHFQTASKRMDGFPINIELLSRYKTAAEQRTILSKLQSGKVDLLIGTHRIIQDDVKFKDLGLVIIDEEQRFGVAHKDKFKEVFSGVDILSLSATPIPRTLNMAMSGIRDMSVLDEPPQDRQPISTYVIEHDDGVIAQAIMKEMRRNGQVYYIHNRIETIYAAAEHLQAMIPDARIGVAHGRMGEDDLLEVWRQLLEGELDILVCTTIIETGVDVPNVNTLIIENADYMGLAQLHQLRGRVGRTNKRAYAYFTFKRGKTLTEIAQKRLDAIREFTQFGSGFRIALADLEIRGAGSILGASQSGHLANVGYDMYLQLLSEAVREEQGEVDVHKEDCLVDIRIDAFIPESYISNQAQRVDCYRKIAMIHSQEDSMDVIDELIDRYGDPPPSVQGLVDVALFRNMAAGVNVVEITQSGDVISFFVAKFDKPRLAAVAEEYGSRLQIQTAGKQRLEIKLDKNEKPLNVMRKVITLMNHANMT
ncbi:MAG: transcription-repair coupling factor [Oscillospiraceae bacterium]